MEDLNYSEVEEHIVAWLKDYAAEARVKGFVIGISGGVDSAVVSTIAAKTGLKLYTIQMPIRQKSDEVSRATSHINWLMENYPNVSTINCDLTNTFESFLGNVEIVEDVEKQNMAEANTRSRLRMVALYYHASIKNCLVLGTGNKVEDFGIGFFTKFGDGGVDVSPIGALMKSQVRELARHMGVSEVIVNAVPTDGLWEDGRGDEWQIGATYDELEWAMDETEFNPHGINAHRYTDRMKKVMEIYLTRHFANKHKMALPPVCNIDSIKGYAFSPKFPK